MTQEAAFSFRPQAQLRFQYLVIFSRGSSKDMTREKRKALLFLVPSIIYFGAAAKRWCEQRNLVSS